MTNSANIMGISREAHEIIIADAREQQALLCLVAHAAELAEDQGLLFAAHRLREAMSEIDKELKGILPRA